MHVDDFVGVLRRVRVVLLGFSRLISSRDREPAAVREVSAQCTVVNFIVTPEGLEATVRGPGAC